VVRGTVIASIVAGLLSVQAATAALLPATYAGQTRVGTSTSGRAVSAGCVMAAGAHATDLVMRCVKSTARAAARYDFVVPAKVTGVTWQVNWQPGSTHVGVRGSMQRVSQKDVRVVVTASGISHADVASVVIEYYVK
jgi:hypothetical protein